MKTINYFIFSALAFIIANNFHWLTYNSFIPSLLDWVGYFLFLAGLFVLGKKNKQ